MNLDEIRGAYISDGANYLDASSRTAQDVLLALIAKSSLSGNVTIKGGVVIQHISGDGRRATRDLDFDFIKYSLSDNAIRNFIGKLSILTNEISVKIIAPIKELNHQDYNGKRVHIRIADQFGTTIDTKLDIGVHKNLDVKQSDYCFDLSKLNDSVTLFINTKKQIFTEKLKSLLRLGAISSRYKDVFDMYYLSMQIQSERDSLIDTIKMLIFDDKSMRENDFNDIYARLDQVFHDPRFRMPLEASQRQNWLDAELGTVLQGLLEYMGSLK